jgi:hypothetical protein
MAPFEIMNTIRFLAALATVCLGLRPIMSLAAESPVPVPAVKDLPVRAAMPDPLVADDGQKIAADQWPQRRVEMLRILEDYQFGHMPPPPGNVKGQELESKLLLDGQVLFRHVHLTFGPEEKLGFDIGIFAPAQTNGVTAPFPTIVTLTFSSGENGVRQYAEALRRGYAVVAIGYQQLGADNASFRQTAFFPAYPDYDWNDFSAWAWGVSRCVDFLQTDPATDKSKIIAIGVSRLAQAVQLAGAVDERIALVGAVGGGCAFRFSGQGHGGKQGLDEVIDQNTFWFGPKLPEFRGQVEKLPFDQHWLLALAAPRHFILCNGLDDQYCNGNASAQSYLNAKPVFALLGVPDNLGVNFRPGRHGMQSEDWQEILDFSDQQLRKLDVKRRFDQLPPPDELH